MKNCHLQKTKTKLNIKTMLKKSSLFRDKLYILGGGSGEINVKNSFISAAI